MPNPVAKLTISAVNGIAGRHGKTFSVQRYVLEPGNAEHIHKYGFDLLGDTWKKPSRGLHQIPPAQLQEFSSFVIGQATDEAIYADNARTDSLYRRGHVYEYRSALIPISAEAVAFIKDEPENSMRLLMRAFTKGALELPAGTLARMRERTKSGARGGALFRELRDDPAIKAYQQAQWDTRASVVGDVMLGRNSIIVNTRHERFTLDNGRYLVDVVNPATREFHILDGSTIWFRIVDTTAHRLIFAVLGSGQHRHATMDAMNNWGAMNIWHNMALVQQHLYDDVPSSYDETTAHVQRARQKAGPIAVKINQVLSSADTDSMGAFMRGLRRRHLSENGDGYLAS